MRLPLAFAIVLIVFNTLIDYYIFRRLLSCRHRKAAWIQIITGGLLQAMAIVAICLPRRSGSEHVLLGVMWMLYAYLSVYIPKLLFTIIDCIGLGIARLNKRLRYFQPYFSWVGIGGGLFVFIALWWGALINRNNIETTHETVMVDGLPKAFEGYKIAQFSDLHVGTWGSDTTFVSHLVDSINAQRPDLIVFTGDIVNSQSKELRFFLKPLSRLKAKDGVISILGNHDYGDYHIWASPEAKAKNLLDLVTMQRKMGWDLLLNQNRIIRRGNDSIVIVGVENIGDPPFRSYGSLPRALGTTNKESPKILLTHNPVHWCDSISSDSSLNIPLTLSGHTHAMQIKVGEFSPAVWRYKTWKGMHHTGDKNLYVNIGAGTVGFPARIGATPEITLLTLRGGSARQG